MENIDDLILPESIKKPKKTTRKKSKPKTIKTDKTVLARTNREVPCAYCQETRVLNPDQYQRYFDYYGSEDKLKKEFVCKSCDMAMQDDPHTFWAKHSLGSKSFASLGKEIKDIIDMFKGSSRTPQDLQVFNRQVSDKVTEYHIKPENLEFVIDRASNLPIMLKISNLPFIGKITLKPYETKDNRIEIHE